MRVKKAIIPVAGLGTRMLPITKSVPKEMLPVFDKPIIQYVVEEAIAAGITEIILITREGKSAISDYFSQNIELETLLEQKGKKELLETLRKNLPHNVSITSATQQEAKGLGHAILCAESLIKNDPFAVLLPDVLIDEYFCTPTLDNLASMVRRYTSTARSQVMVERVSMERVHQYGVVDCQGHPLLNGRNHLITTIVEKPKNGTAPSNLCVVGRYVFGTGIWKHLKNVKPDASGEVQLTDAIAILSQQEKVEAYCIVGKSHDCGNKCGYAKANLEYALRDQHVGQELENLMRETLIFEHRDSCKIAVNA